MYARVYELKSLNQLIEPEHATAETNGLMLPAFHACREETEAIIRGWAEISLSVSPLLLDRFVLYSWQLILPPFNYSMQASLSCYMCVLFCKS